MKILVTSLLRIFFEIKEHIDDFEMEANRHAFSSSIVESERENIWQVVLTPFVNHLVQQGEINTSDEALFAIEILISSWDGFRKRTII